MEEKGNQDAGRASEQVCGARNQSTTKWPALYRLDSDDDDEARCRPAGRQFVLPRQLTTHTHTIRECSDGRQAGRQLAFATDKIRP